MGTTSRRRAKKIELLLFSCLLCPGHFGTQPFVSLL